MVIIDKIDTPQVVSFIQDQLSPFETENIEWFKLLPLRRHVPYRGECSGPGWLRSRHIKRYRLRCSINPHLSWPYEEEFHIRRVRNLVVNGRRRRYLRELAIFENAHELLVWLAGHEVYHFLTMSKQVRGQAGYEAKANRYGFEWLSAWRDSHNDGFFQGSDHAEDPAGRRPPSVSNAVL